MSGLADKGFLLSDGDGAFLLSVKKKTTFKLGPLVSGLASFGAKFGPWFQFSLMLLKAKVGHMIQYQEL